MTPALKTVFIIVVATYRMIFPGVPVTVPAPGVEQPKTPPATRSITMDLWTDQKLGPQHKPEVALPEGLKAGGKAKLMLDIRTASNDQPASDQPGSITRVYWGSSATVPEGQPKIVVSGQAGAGAAEAAISLPTGSHAYWPAQDTEPLKEDAAVPGTYTLTTTDGPGTSVTLDKDQDFLGTIHLVGVRAKTDLNKPVKITWEPLPGALAYIVNAYGGNEKESTTWTSSADPKAADGIENRPLTRDQVAALIESKVLLPPTASTVTIPARAFGDSRSVFVAVTAIGADKVQVKDGVETRVLVRSQVSVPIAGTTYKPVPENEEGS